MKKVVVLLLIVILISGCVQLQDQTSKVRKYDIPFLRGRAQQAVKAFGLEVNARVWPETVENGNLVFYEGKPYNLIIDLINHGSRVDDLTVNVHQLNQAFGGLAEDSIETSLESAIEFEEPVKETMRFENFVYSGLTRPDGRELESDTQIFIDVDLDYFVFISSSKAVCWDYRESSNCPGIMSVSGKDLGIEAEVSPITVTKIVRKLDYLGEEQSSEVNMILEIFLDSRGTDAKLNHVINNFDAEFISGPSIDCNYQTIDLNNLKGKPIICETSFSVDRESSSPVIIKFDYPYKIRRSFKADLKPMKEQKQII